MNVKYYIFIKAQYLTKCFNIFVIISIRNADPDPTLEKKLYSDTNVKKNWIRPDNTIQNAYASMKIKILILMSRLKVFCYMVTGVTKEQLLRDANIMCSTFRF